MNLLQHPGVTPKSEQKKRPRRPLEVDLAVLPDDALVEKHVRRAFTGLGDSEAYRRISLGTYPAPIKLGPRCARWRLGDLRAWLADPNGWGKK